MMHWEQTSRIVSSVLHAVETLEEHIDDFLSSLRREIVEIRKDSAHFESETIEISQLGITPKIKKIQ